VLERYQRRTARLAAQVGVVVTELAGRASVLVLSALAAPLSRHTAIRTLRSLPAPARPPTRPSPQGAAGPGRLPQRSRVDPSLAADSRSCSRTCRSSPATTNGSAPSPPR
jgi:hypothetical protein